MLRSNKNKINFSSLKRFLLTLPKDTLVKTVGEKVAQKLANDPSSVTARDIALAPLSLEDLSKW